MEQRLAHWAMNSKDYRAGTYDLKDVSTDPTWGDVKCVESHRSPAGVLISIVNHREKDFDAACVYLEQLGACGGLITPCSTNLGDNQHDNKN